MREWMARYRLPSIAALFVQVVGCDGSTPVVGTEERPDTVQLPYRYEVVAITSVPGDSVTPVDLNDAGHVLVQAKAGDGVWHSYILQEDKVVDLGPFRGRALNNLGQVAGNVIGSGPILDASLWHAGVFRRIEGCNSVFAYGINDLGHVVGTCGGLSSFLWDSIGGFRLLPHRDEVIASSARGINDRGEIIGDGGATFNDFLLVWRDGAVHFLPGGERGPFRGTAINNSGYAVGYIRLGRGASPVAGYLWDSDDQPTDLGTLFGERTPVSEWNRRPLEETRPHDLNESLEVVGDATLRSGEWRGFLWTEGVIRDLTALVLDPRWVITSSVGINAHGDVIGTARLSGGGESPVLLRRRPGSAAGQ